MAGVIGSARAADNAHLSSLARRMAKSLGHRGPDSAGTWADGDNAVALAHARLAIIDLSPAGHQPMLSADEGLVVVFNGEIYNHDAIRRELAANGLAPQWRGHSDTETLLAAVSAWGVERTLPRLRGMFAFAIWDRRTRTLHLARDRVGEKPLYYGWVGGDFVFGSELRALRCHRGWRGDIDKGVLALFMRYGYVPAPYSIHCGIHQLLPGHYLRLSLDERGVQQRDCTVEPYWSLPAVIAEAKASPFVGSPDEAADKLHQLLLDAVGEQMMADVPHGAFLSGGIDSSTIVALMQVHSTRPVKTFTIGFEEHAHNEAEHAKAVARHLGTEHTELYVRPKEALDVVEQLPSIYDEPFADSSQIPTYLLSRMTRDHVTVALSGDGGDEVFAGYERYVRATKLMQRLDSMPPVLRRALSSGLMSIEPGSWDRLLNPGLALAGKRNQRLNPGQKMHKWAEFLGSNRANVHRYLLSVCENPASLGLGGEPPTIYSDGSRQYGDGTYLEHMMSLDMSSYLPDDILVKVDRAAMAVGLETRIPILDERVVRFAWSLPDSIRWHEGRTKWPLRKVLARYVPRSLTDRPKQGFSIPIEQWLRGPLRAWADSLLEPRLVREQGLLSPDGVSRIWTWFLDGHDEVAPAVWTILMFQAWLRANGANEASRTAATATSDAPDAHTASATNRAACLA